MGNSCSDVCTILVAHLKILGFEELEPHGDHGKIIAAMEQLFALGPMVRDNRALGLPPALGEPPSSWITEYEDMMRRRMNSSTSLGIAGQIAQTAALTGKSVDEVMELFREAVRQVLDSGLL